MELLARKTQISLAQQGRELLDQKRGALMHELMRTADQALVDSAALQRSAVEARRALARAEAIAGPEAVRSAALAAHGELTIGVQSTNVMGVSVPTIEQARVTRPALGRGYAFAGTSVTIDEAATAFEAEVEDLIQLAESELRLRRLATEIQNTSRRLNALEHVIIPRLESERDYIQVTLDERERADHFRLKRVKQVRQRRTAR